MKTMFLRLLLVVALGCPAITTNAAVREWTGGVSGYWSDSKTRHAGRMINHEIHQTHEKGTRRAQFSFVSFCVFRGSRSSCPEFQETVNKSKAMLKAVALAETFAKTS